MTPAKFRQQVYTDTDLTGNARLIMMLVLDYHMMEHGCVLKDSTISDEVGVSVRTVERRRKELYNAGYLREVNGANRRKLVPIDPDTGDEIPDTGVVAPDSSDEQPDTGDGSAPDTGVVDKDKDISANAQRCAPAHEDSGDSQIDPRSEPPEEVFSELVDIWRSVSSAPALNRRLEDVLWGWAQDEKIPDLGLFRDVLEEQAANVTAKGSGMSPGILLREYREQLNSGKLEPWQQEDERYSVGEQGRVCFKGVPVEETGPQNLAADLQDQSAKDGAPAGEPEVSLHG